MRAEEASCFGYREKEMLQNNLKKSLLRCCFPACLLWLRLFGAGPAVGPARLGYL